MEKWDTIWVWFLPSIEKCLPRAEFHSVVWPSDGSTVLSLLPFERQNWALGTFRLQGQDLTWSPPGLQTLKLMKHNLHNSCVYYLHEGKSRTLKLLARNWGCENWYYKFLKTYCFKIISKIISNLLYKSYMNKTKNSHKPFIQIHQLLTFFHILLFFFLWLFLENNFQISCSLIPVYFS